MEISKENKHHRSKKLLAPPKNDFAFPIYVQRRKDVGVTVICPDMNIARTLPLPKNYVSISDFHADLAVTMMEVDRLAIEEFIRRDKDSKYKHRESLFPRGLKDHLEIDLQNLRFKPPQAALLTTKSARTWRRWCMERRCKRRSNGLKFEKRHYLIPFPEIEPFLREEFIENPRLILSFIKK